MRHTKSRLRVLGDRIRVGGTAGITGYDLRLRESRRKTLVHFSYGFVPMVVMSAKLNSGLACAQ